MYMVVRFLNQFLTHIVSLYIFSGFAFFRKGCGETELKKIKGKSYFMIFPLFPYQLADLVL